MKARNNTYRRLLPNGDLILMLESIHRCLDVEIRNTGSLVARHSAVALRSVLVLVHAQGPDPPTWQAVKAHTVLIARRCLIPSYHTSIFTGTTHTYRCIH